MKKTVLAILLAISSSCYAAITPAVPYLQSGPDIPSVNDANWALTSITVDVFNDTVIATFHSGTATVVSAQTTAFSPDPNGAVVTITYTTPGGVPQASSSTGASWKLSSAEITALTSIFSGALISSQNVVESQAVTHNVFGTGATNVPWASGDY